MFALRCMDLSHAYSDGTHSLEQINLAVPVGDCFGLVGSNGAGKSSFIRICASLLKKQSGKLFLCQHDIDKGCGQWRAKVSVVMQEPNLSLYDTAEDVVLNTAGYAGIRRAEAKIRARSLFKRLGLWELRRKQSHTLSGGMRRRLMLARALITDPELLILDEPTNGVDIDNRYIIWESLKQINQKGTTIILSSHYLNEIQYLCRHVAILEAGRIKREGAVSGVLPEATAGDGSVMQKESLLNVVE